MDSFEDIYTYLDNRFIIYNFDSGHQLSHALIVAGHAYNALHDFPDLNIEQRDAIILACILHDVNDHKFIGQDEQVNITQLISPYVSSNTIQLTIKMINLVSCSSNGDSVITPSWLAIPRYADRLEAMGEIGLSRAISYSKYTGRPFIDSNTKRARNEDELNSIACVERYQQYTSGKLVSPTTMDHLYDKVLHLSVPGWLGSPTLETIAKERKIWLKRYILNYFYEGLNYII